MQLNNIFGNIYSSTINIGRIDRIFSASNPVPYSIMQLISLCAIIFALSIGYDWYWWVIAIIIAQITVGMGISCGYHRLWTHRSYIASLPLKVFYGICGIWTMAGSPSGFSFVHLIHHKYSDQKGDPHAPSLCGWRTFSAGHGYADVSGYVDTLKNNPRILFRIRHMMKYFCHKILHKYFWLLAIIPPILCLSISNEVFLFCWLIPSAVRLWIGPFSLWYSHRENSAIEDRPHKTFDKSCNSNIIGLFLWEGPHNNHHKFPRKWSYKFNGKGYDPGTYFLRLMFLLRLAKNE